MRLMERSEKTGTPYYYRLTGMRLMAIQLKDFYEKQMIDKNRIIPEKGETMNVKQIIVALVVTLPFSVFQTSLALAQSCDLDGVVGYFMSEGVVKAVLSFAFVGITLFFSLTKKSVPGALGKFIGIVRSIVAPKSAPK